MTYHVVPRGSVWDVRPEGGGKDAVSNLPNKTSAVNTARGFLMNKGGGNICIHNETGFDEWIEVKV